MIRVENKNLEKIRYLFTDIRFYIGKSVLDGEMGQAFVDNIEKPTYAVLLVSKYCFISGIINSEILKDIFNEFSLKNYTIIPSDEVKKVLENTYMENLNKFQRYSLKKNPQFNITKLKSYINDFSEEEFEFVKIDSNIADRIREEEFMLVTDNYRANRIGYCCLYDNEIVGVATSNIFYKDGIEVNIKVKEDYRRKGLATVLTSMLILACLEKNKKVSWDAANLNSLKLATKLGFEFDSEYDCYKFV